MHSKILVYLKKRYVPRTNSRLQASEIRLLRNGPVDAHPNRSPSTGSSPVQATQFSHAQAPHSGLCDGLPLLLAEAPSYGLHRTANKDTIPRLPPTPCSFRTVQSVRENRPVGALQRKRVEHEDEERVVSLKRLLMPSRAPVGSDRKLRRTRAAERTRFSDYGVNNAVEADPSQGRLGVFWHTQGSGKSFSMAFFARKVLRKQPGNWSFVVITDRQDLDDQIYKTFANTHRHRRRCPGRE